MFKFRNNWIWLDSGLIRCRLVGRSWPSQGTWQDVKSFYLKDDLASSGTTNLSSSQPSDSDLNNVKADSKVEVHYVVVDEILRPAYLSSRSIYACEHVIFWRWDRCLSKRQENISINLLSRLS